MTHVTEHPKSRRVRAPRRERGPLLTAWIALVAVFGVYTAIAQGLLQSSALGLASSAFLFLCAWGLWKWQRWAYYSLMVVFAIVGAVLLSALFNNLQNLAPFIIVLAAAGATVAIVHPRLEEFR